MSRALNFDYQFDAGATKAPVVTLVADPVVETAAQIVCKVRAENLGLVFQYEHKTVSFQNSTNQPGTSTTVGGVNGNVSANDRCLRLDFLPLEQYVRGMQEKLLLETATFTDDIGQTPKTLNKVAENLTGQASGSQLLNKLPAAALVSRSIGQMAFLNMLIDVIQTGPLYYNPAVMTPTTENSAIRILFGQADEQGMLLENDGAGDLRRVGYPSMLSGVGFEANKVLFQEEDYLDINIRFKVDNKFVYRVESALGALFGTQRTAGTFRVGNTTFTINNDGTLQGGDNVSGSAYETYKIRFVASSSGQSVFTNPNISEGYDFTLRNLVQLYSVPSTPPPTTSDQVRTFDLTLRSDYVDPTGSNFSSYKEALTSIRGFINSNAQYLNNSKLMNAGLIPSQEAIALLNNPDPVQGELPSVSINGVNSTDPDFNWENAQTPLTWFMNNVLAGNFTYISGTVIPVKAPNDTRAFGPGFLGSYRFANFNRFLGIVSPSKQVKLSHNGNINHTANVPNYTINQMVVIPFAGDYLTLRYNGKEQVLTEMFEPGTEIKASDNSDIGMVYGYNPDENTIMIGPTNGMIARTLLTDSTQVITDLPLAFVFVQPDPNPALSRMIVTLINEAVYYGTCYALKDDNTLSVANSPHSTFHLVGFHTLSGTSKTLVVLPPTGQRYLLNTAIRTIDDGIILQQLIVRGTRDTADTSVGRAFVRGTTTNASFHIYYATPVPDGDTTSHVRSSNLDPLSLTLTAPVPGTFPGVSAAILSNTTLTNITDTIFSESVNGTTTAHIVTSNPGATPSPTASPKQRIPYVNNLYAGNLTYAMLNTIPETRATYTPSSYLYRETNGEIRLAMGPDLKTFGGSPVNRYVNIPTNQNVTTFITPSYNATAARLSFGNRSIGTTPTSTILLTSDVINGLRRVLLATATTAAHTDTTGYIGHYVDYFPTFLESVPRSADIYVSNLAAQIGSIGIGGVSAQPLSAYMAGGVTLTTTNPVTAAKNVKVVGANLEITVPLTSTDYPTYSGFSIQNHRMFLVRPHATMSGVYTETACTFTANSQATISGVRTVKATCPVNADVHVGANSFFFVFVPITNVTQANISTLFYSIFNKGA
jgi:hypothetical protein